MRVHVTVLRYIDDVSIAPIKEAAIDVLMNQIKFMLGLGRIPLHSWLSGRKGSCTSQKAKLLKTNIFKVCT